METYVPLSPFGPGIYRYKEESKLRAASVSVGLKDAAQLLSAKAMRIEVSFKNAGIDFNEFKTVLNTHFNREQLTVLQRADLSGNNLGIKGR